LWIAQQLANGQLDHTLFLTLRKLEDGQQAASAKQRLAEAALSANPNVAFLHLHHGLNLAAANHPTEPLGVPEGSSARPEPDLRTRLLTQLGLIEADRAQKLAWLEEAAALRGNLIAAATAVMALRSLAN